MSENTWPTNPFVPQGITQVWYAKPGYARDAMMGYDWLAENGLLPDLKDLSKTHVLLGTVQSIRTEDVFCLMQGESWSPNGEANEMIEAKGLWHTSMSVGDIMVRLHRVHMVDRFGFKHLGGTPREAEAA
jgi:hypothetical protein